MVRWIRWHCPPDTEFAIRALAVWGRHATYRSRRLPTIFNLHEWAEIFCFFETWIPERGLNPRSATFQAGSFNQCTRAPALLIQVLLYFSFKIWNHHVLVGCSFLFIWMPMSCFYDHYTVIYIVYSSAPGSTLGVRIWHLHRRQILASKKEWLKLCPAKKNIILGSRVLSSTWWSAGARTKMTNAFSRENEMNRALGHLCAHIG